MEMASFGKKRSYDDFKKQIPIPVQPQFDLIREYCMTLGDNVVEDIRMHRVVFGKSMSFRWFADVAPEENSIVIKIQKSRKEPHNTKQIQLGQSIDDIKALLKEAYETIH